MSESIGQYDIYNIQTLVLLDIVGYLPIFVTVTAQGSKKRTVPEN